jgi:Cip1-like, core domain
MKGGYTIAIDTTQAHSGKNSVHATFTAAAGYAYISETKTFPATDFWGRAFMRFMAPPGGHQVFAGSDTAMDEATGDQMRYMNDMGGMLTMNIRSTDAVAKSTKALPMGTWNCYEWHQTTTMADLYMDGAMIGTAMGAGFKGLATPYVAMVLGGERFGGGVAGDVWIDDVAVDTAQIGCK